jgi:hypothetical protein
MRHLAPASMAQVDGVTYGKQATVAAACLHKQSGLRHRARGNCGRKETPAEIQPQIHRLSLRLLRQMACWQAQGDGVTKLLGYLVTNAESYRVTKVKKQMDNKEPTFSEREINEIKFCVMYAEEFGHGTDGHNRMLLVAKLAKFCADEHIRLIATDPVLPLYES